MDDQAMNEELQPAEGAGSGDCAAEAPSLVLRAFEALDCGVLVLDAGGALVYANPAACEALACDEDGLRAAAGDFAILYEERAEMHLRQGQGKPVSVEVSARQFEDGGRTFRVVALKDIRRHVELRNSLKKLSLYDELTDLYNRRGFETVAEHRIQLARRYGRVSALLLYADIDNLKVVNDRFGHLMGDEVLRAFGRAMRGAFRRSDVIGRIGGDEFAVLAEVRKDLSAEILKGRLQEAVDRENTALEGKGVSLRFSMGTYAAPHLGEANLTQLLGQADREMYRAKLQIPRNGG
jgi:diguanylate cyclase (GGDEF)-like protein